jgi:hypothetical protein
MKQKKKLKKTLENLDLYVSPIWGVTHVKPIVMKCGDSIYLTDVIIRSIIGIHWYGSLALERCKVCSFPWEQQTVLITSSPVGLAGDNNIV